MKTCPLCRRRLLSHASVRCNWCGTLIDDTEYQETAHLEREAFFAHQAEHDAQSLDHIGRLNIAPYDACFGHGLAQRPIWIPAGSRKATVEAGREQVQVSDNDTISKICENELPRQEMSQSHKAASSTWSGDDHEQQP